MTKPKVKGDVTEAYEQARERSAEKLPERFVLRLYVIGMTERSKNSIASIKEICEGHLMGEYDLEVVDLMRHPQLAKDEQIVAAPTLIRKLPLPLRRLVGDLSDTERVLLGLDLRAQPPVKGD